MDDDERDKEMAERERRRLERSIMKSRSASNARKPLFGRAAARKASNAAVEKKPAAAATPEKKSAASGKSGGNWRERQAKLDQERKEREARVQADLEEQRKRDEEEQKERDRLRGRTDFWRLKDDEIFSSVDFSSLPEVKQSASTSSATKKTSTLPLTPVEKEPAPPAKKTSTMKLTPVSAPHTSSTVPAVVDARATKAGTPIDASSELDSLLSGLEVSAGKASAKQQRSLGRSLPPSESVDNMLANLEQSAQSRQASTVQAKAREEQARKEKERAAEEERKRAEEERKRREVEDRERAAEERRQREERRRAEDERRKQEAAEKKRNEELSTAKPEERAAMLLDYLVDDCKRLSALLKQFTTSHVNEFLEIVQRLNKNVADFGKSFYAPVKDDTTQNLVESTLTLMRACMSLMDVTKKTSRADQMADVPSSPFGQGKEQVRVALISLVKLLMQAKSRAGEFAKEHERRQQHNALVVAVRRCGEISTDILQCIDNVPLNHAQFNELLASVVKTVRDAIQLPEAHQALLPLVKELLFAGKEYRASSTEANRVGFTTKLSGLLNGILSLIQNDNN